MQKIPKIQFQKSKVDGVEGFELIWFDDLFARKKISENHDPFKPHRLNFFVIFIITAGEVKHYVDFKTCHLKKGDCLVLSKEQIHHFDPHATYQGYMVVFTETFLEKYIARIAVAYIRKGLNYFIQTNLFHSPNTNLALITELSNSNKIDTPVTRACIIGATLSRFLLKILDDRKSQQIRLAQSKELEYFNHFRLLLIQNYTTTRDAKFYAQELHISYKHLNEICKAVVQQTAKSFIDTYVILESKRYLVASPLSVKEITYQLGFDEPTNFVKYFKKHTFSTPHDFRSSLS